MYTHGEERASSGLKPFLLILLMPGLFACESSNNTPVPEKSKPDTIATVQVPVQKDTNDKRPVLYLTFDDGPNTGTRIVLNILAEEQVPASFFIIGLHVYGSPEQHKLWHRLQETPGIVICNHSFTHAFRNHYNTFYNLPDSAVKDFRRNADSLHFTNNIVRTPGTNLWRMPGVYANDVIKQRKATGDSIAHAGYVIAGWDWEWRFNRKSELMQTEEELLGEIDGLFKSGRTRIPGNLILLAHDHSFIDAGDSTRLHNFIHTLKTEGKYRLALVTEYPGLHANAAN